MIVLQAETFLRIINGIIDLIPWDVVVAGLIIMLGADALGIYPFQDLLVDLLTVVWQGIVDTATAIWNWLVGLFGDLWNDLLDALSPV